MPFDLTQQGLFMHHAEHPLMVDLPSLSLQGMGHPTIAIAGKVQNDFLYRITQRHFFGPLGWLHQDVAFAIVPSTIDLQQLAEMANGNGQLLLACAIDYRMSLLKGSLPNAFFSRAFSKASCPQKCSSSAILASADGGSALGGGRKASSPR